MAVQAYLVNIPVVPKGIYAFSFTTTLAGLGWAFTFLFINNRWTCYATPPSLQVREATVYNNTLNWSGFPDFGCMFSSNLPSIGLNDINNVSMYIFDWRY
jgi:hypothetical protein